METKKTSIDLGQYISSNHQPHEAMNGSDYGDRVRELSKIDDLADAYDEIEIIIPRQVRTLSLTFLLGFLKNVVEKLGMEGFFEKFTWKSLADEPNEYLEMNFVRAASMILLKQSARSAWEKVH